MYRYTVYAYFKNANGKREHIHPVTVLFWKFAHLHRPPPNYPGNKLQIYILYIRVTDGFLCLKRIYYTYFRYLWRWYYIVYADCLVHIVVTVFDDNARPLSRSYISFKILYGPCGIIIKDMNLVRDYYPVTYNNIIIIHTYKYIILYRIFPAIYIFTYLSFVSNFSWRIKVFKCRLLSQYYTVYA